MQREAAAGGHGVDQLVDALLYLQWPAQYGSPPDVEPLAAAPPGAAVWLPFLLCTMV